MEVVPGEADIYTLSTHYLHTIYKLSTHYLHTIYTLYLHTIYTGAAGGPDLLRVPGPALLRAPLRGEAQAALRHVRRAHLLRVLHARHGPGLALPPLQVSRVTCQRVSLLTCLLAAAGTVTPS